MDADASLREATRAPQRGAVIDDGVVTVLLSNHIMERPRWNEMLVENDDGEFAPYAFRTGETLFLRKVIGGRLDPARAGWLTHSTWKFIDAVFPEDKSQRWIHTMDDGVDNGECCVVYRTDSGRYVVDTSFIDGDTLNIQFTL
jgi:hypothetical protein